MLIKAALDWVLITLLIRFIIKSILSLYKVVVKLSILAPKELDKLLIIILSIIII
jgi:hypothetical protein